MGGGGGGGHGVWLDLQAPHHTASNPSTVQDCRIYNWTGPAAITFNLRGPLTLLDNQFSSGMSKPLAVHSTPWHTTNQVIMAAGNMINGVAVAAHGVLGGLVAPNVFLYDLSDTGVASNLTAGLDARSTFLKAWWPGMPTALVDATTHGCTGDAEDDATACAQATITAAAELGGGVAAYFPPGTYAINATLVIKAGNYTVMGAGFNTVFAWAGSAAPNLGAVVVVQGGGGGLRLAHLSILSGSKALAHDTKLLHDGATPGEGAKGAARTTTYDGVYTACPGTQLWNATGIEVRGLKVRGSCGGGTSVMLPVSVHGSMLSAPVLHSLAGLHNVV